MIIFGWKTFVFWWLQFRKVVCSVCPQLGLWASGMLEGSTDNLFPYLPASHITSRRSKILSPSFLAIFCQYIPPSTLHYCHYIPALFEWIYLILFWRFGYRESMLYLCLFQQCWLCSLSIICGSSHYFSWEFSFARLSLIFTLWSYLAPHSAPH